MLDKQYMLVTKVSKKSLLKNNYIECKKRDCNATFPLLNWVEDRSRTDDLLNHNQAVQPTSTLYKPSDIVTSRSFSKTKFI